MPDALFRLRDAGVRYGANRALQAVSLTVSRGELVGIIGPSGSGKSSLLGLLNARRVADAGTVEVLGRSLGGIDGRELRAVRREVAWIPQDLGLVPNLRVIQNVACGRAGKRRLGSFVRSLLFTSMTEAERIHALLEHLGISEKLYERASSLSGGEAQRVAIARALYQEPLAILADEPVSAVDPERARSLLKLLVQSAREEGLTLVASLHHVELAREFFPRLVGLREGRVMFDKAGAEVSKEEMRQLYALGGERDESR